MTAGGALMNTTEVENSPGFRDGIMGELMGQMRAQAERSCAELVADDVVAGDLTGEVKVITTTTNTYTARSVILATGSGYRTLGLPREEELSGRGVVHPVTDLEVETTVLQATKTVLVDFWAEWCGPCRQVAPPILEEIAAEHSEDLIVVKVNVDENPQTPTQYRVTGIPTLAVFTDGELQRMIVGAKPKEALLNALHLTTT